MAILNINELIIIRDAHKDDDCFYLNDGKDTYWISLSTIKRAINNYHRLYCRICGKHANYFLVRKEINKCSLIPCDITGKTMSFYKIPIKMNNKAKKILHIKGNVDEVYACKDCINMKEKGSKSLTDKDIVSVIGKMIPTTYENILRRSNKRYSMNEVFSLVPDDFMTRKCIDFDGDKTKFSSLKLLTFKKNNKCYICGNEGSYFVKEKHFDEQDWHLSLYGIDKDGKEFRMSKEYIVPLKKGGTENISNTRTICEHCLLAKDAINN
jgi:hypothetical protein